jgi:uncharacterized DUF497 family protein
MQNDFVYRDTYIWNVFKNNFNKRDHKISFETAVEAFNDPLAIVVFDEKNSTAGEDRYRLTGYIPIRPSFITISFTPKPGLTRIFSARKADDKEKEAYIENAGSYCG